MPASTTCSLPQRGAARQETAAAAAVAATAAIDFASLVFDEEVGNPKPSSLNPTSES